MYQFYMNNFKISKKTTPLAYEKLCIEIFRTISYEKSYENTINIKYSCAFSPKIHGRHAHTGCINSHRCLKKYSLNLWQYCKFISYKKKHLTGTKTR